MRSVLPRILHYEGIRLSPRTFRLNHFPCSAALSLSCSLGPISIQRARSTSTLPSVTAPVEYPFGTRDTPYTRQQLHTIEDIQPNLLAALRARDFNGLSSYWSILVQDGILGLVRPRYWADYSAVIDRIGDEIPEGLNKPAIDALDLLAAHAAAGGHYLGLCSRMRFHMTHGAPNRAIRLFIKTYKLNQQRDVLFAGQSALPPFEYRQLTARFGKRRPLSMYVVGHAVTAFAMKNSLHEALQVFLHPSMSRNRLVLNYAALHKTLPMSTDDPVLLKRAFTFGSRIYLALALDDHKPVAIARLVEHLFVQSTPNNLHAGLFQFLDEISDSPSSSIAFHPTSEPVSPRRHVLVGERSQKWQMVMRVAIQYGFHDYSERLRAKLQKVFGRVPARVWAGMIEGCASLRRFDEVQTTWDTACSSGKPGVEVYRAYLSALFAEGRWEDAMGVFDSFRRTTQVGDLEGQARVHENDMSSVYQVVLQQLVEKSKLDEAWTIFLDMRRKGPHPSTQSYNLFLRHFAETSQVERLTSTFEDMQNDNSKLVARGSIESWSWFLIGLCTLHRDAVHQVLERELKKERSQANAAFCARMIQFLTKEDKDEKAFTAAITILEYLDRHMSGPLQPTELSLTSLQCAVERRVWVDPALEKSFREIIIRVAERHDRSLLVRSQSVTDIVMACLQNPTPEAAQRAWQYYRTYAGPVPGSKLFRASAWVPNDTLWVTLLDGLRVRKEWILADLLVKEIEQWSHFVWIPLVLKECMELTRKRSTKPVRDVEHRE